MAQYKMLKNWAWCIADHTLEPREPQGDHPQQNVYILTDKPEDEDHT